MILDGKKVLVTGGTGSLGERVVHRLLDGRLGRPERVVVLSRDEAKQHDMRLRFNRRDVATDDVIYERSRESLSFRVGDVRDYQSMLAAVRDAHVVIHAAALKQVPTCEYFPREAVLTNVLGTDTLVRAVRDGGRCCEAVVGISTDKACMPINVMGMTKAVMERMLIEANVDDPGGPRFLAVRYGNVIASRGSVLPLFLHQIAHGGPVTLTLRTMTRFLLTLDQAVETVMAALAGARPGEIYVPKAVAARMVDLVTVLLGGREIPVTTVGLRPGEKVHEVMVSEEERHRTLERDGYYVICPMLPECDPLPVPVPALAKEYSSADHPLDIEALRTLVSPFLEPGGTEHVPSSVRGR
jgi:FlaA1/EpsC-like NDP-sugar epimerase